MAPAALKTQRQEATERGRKLEYFTILWNGTEAVVAIAAGVMAGSVSMVGFGMDSFIEVISGTALLWRMSIDYEDPRLRRRERIALRIVSICFIALAAYITFESVANLLHKRKPETSILGIVLAVVSLIVMPVITHLKRKVGTDLSSAAMHADAQQTQFSFYLSIILLFGLVANAVLGWWWADPLAAAGMVPFIAKEGMANLDPK